jgi:hypothetical protein
MKIMTPNKFNFGPQNLIYYGITIDYITISIAELTSVSDLKIIATEIFNKYNLNTRYNFNERDPKIKLIVTASAAGDIHAAFRNCWGVQSCQLRFAGVSSRVIYNFICGRQFDWEIFENYTFNISRIDIARDCAFVDENLARNFFKVTNEHLESQRISYSYKYPKLAIGERTNRHGNGQFLRIYHKNKSQVLRFELELKKYKTRRLMKLFLSSDVDSIEKVLINEYSDGIKKFIPLESYCMQWFLDLLRKKNSVNLNMEQFRNLGYLKQQFALDENVKISRSEYTFRVIQLFVFLQGENANFIPDMDNNYSIRTFPLIDFIKFTGGDFRSSYQRNKYKILLLSLQANLNPFVQPYVTKYHIGLEQASPIRTIRIYKNKRLKGSLVVEIWVLKLLHEYTQPFKFPILLFQAKTVNEIEVKVRLLIALTSVDREKYLNLRGLFDASPSNRDKQEMKLLIINLLKLLEENGIIESKYEIKKLNKKGITRVTNELTLGSFSHAEIIKFYEVL